MLVQGAGLDATTLAASVCNLGLVPGEITHRAVYWFSLQVVAALPRASGAQESVPGGVAVVAIIGGFLTGAALAKLFANKALVERHVEEHRRAVAAAWS